MDGNWNWTSDTRPFWAPDGRQPACIALREVSDNEFELLESFDYRCADGKTVIPVTPESLPETDLASIPSYLGWFARRHGRHTPAALLHDELVTRHRERLPEVAKHLTRAEADLVFREALIASDVPLIKSWMLWTGVALLTRWRTKPRILLVLWFAAALAGTGLLLWGLRTSNPWFMAVALMAPAPLAALWGRAWPAGLVAGYAFWVVVFGSLPGWLAYELYWAIEHGVVLLRRLRPQNRGVPLPPPEPFTQR